MAPISSEFSSAVQHGNLLRARIMLKDSMLVDPTFNQFDSMLGYAKSIAPDIIMCDDGEELEEDRAKWDLQLMNLEMVRLVTNFSLRRIKHLKEIISVVRADEIRKIRSRQAEPVRDDEAAYLRRGALSEMASAGREIGRTVDEVRRKRAWTPADVNRMEREAQRIIEAAHRYKMNR